MLSAVEQMIQLLAYNQLLMSQVTDVQEEPLDLSLPKSHGKQLPLSPDAKIHRPSNCLSNNGNILPPHSPDLKMKVKDGKKSSSPCYSSMPHSPVSLADSNPSDCSSDGDSSYISDIGCPVRSGKPLLWHFLYNLLESCRFDEIIVWLDRDGGHFQIKHPNLLATMWGQCKSNPNMTFECLSRSLRAYYQKGIICKKSRLQYQFSNQALASLKRGNAFSVSTPPAAPAN